MSSKGTNKGKGSLSKKDEGKEVASESANKVIELQNLLKIEELKKQLLAAKKEEDDEDEEEVVDVIPKSKAAKGPGAKASPTVPDVVTKTKKALLAEKRLAALEAKKEHEKVLAGIALNKDMTRDQKEDGQMRLAYVLNTQVDDVKLIDMLLGVKGTGVQLEGTGSALVKSGEVIAIILQRMNDGKLTFGKKFSVQHNWKVNFVRADVSKKGVIGDHRHINPDAPFVNQDQNRPTRGLNVMIKTLKKHYNLMKGNMKKSGTSDEGCWTYRGMIPGLSLAATCVSIDLYESSMETRNTALSTGDMFKGIDVEEQMEPDSTVAEAAGNVHLSSSESGTDGGVCELVASVPSASEVKDVKARPVKKSVNDPASRCSTPPLSSESGKNTPGFLRQQQQSMQEATAAFGKFQQAESTKVAQNERQMDLDAHSHLMEQKESELLNLKRKMECVAMMKSVLADEEWKAQMLDVMREIEVLSSKTIEPVMKNVPTSVGPNSFGRSDSSSTSHGIAECSQHSELVPHMLSSPVDEGDRRLWSNSTGFSPVSVQKSNVKSGTGSGSGTQSRLSSLSNNKSGTGSQSGTEYGTGSESGTQSGTGSQSGTQSGTGSQSGSQSGTGFQSGAQSTSRFQSRTHVGEGHATMEEYKQLPSDSEEESEDEVFTGTTAMVNMGQVEHEIGQMDEKDSSYGRVLETFPWTFSHFGDTLNPYIEGGSLVIVNGVTAAIISERSVIQNHLADQGHPVVGSDIHFPDTHRVGMFPYQLSWVSGDYCKDVVAIDSIRISGSYCFSCHKQHPPAAMYRRIFCTKCRRVAFADCGGTVILYLDPLGEERWKDTGSFCCICKTGYKYEQLQDDWLEFQPPAPVIHQLRREATAHDIEAHNRGVPLTLGMSKIDVQLASRMFDDEHDDIAMSIQSDSGSGTEIGTETGTEIGTEHQVPPESSAEPGTEPESNAETGTEIGTEHQVPLESSAEPGTEPESDAKTGTEIGTEHQDIPVSPGVSGTVRVQMSPEGTIVVCDEDVEAADNGDDVEDDDDEEDNTPLDMDDGMGQHENFDGKHAAEVFFDEDGNDENAVQDVWELNVKGSLHVYGIALGCKFVINDVKGDTLMSRIKWHVRNILLKSHLVDLEDGLELTNEVGEELVDELNVSDAGLFPNGNILVKKLLRGYPADLGPEYTYPSFDETATKSGANAESGTQSGTESGTEYCTEPESCTKSRTQSGTGTQSGTKSGADSNCSAESCTQAGTKSGADANCTVESSTESGTTVKSGTQSGTQYGTGNKSGTEYGTGNKSGTESRTQSGTGNKSGTESGTGNKSGTQSGTQSGTGNKSGTESGTGNKSGTQSRTQSGTGNKSGTESGTQSGTGNKSGTESGTQSGTHTHPCTVLWSDKRNVPFYYYPDQHKGQWITTVPELLENPVVMSTDPRVNQTYMAEYRCPDLNSEPISDSEAEDESDTQPKSKIEPKTKSRPIVKSGTEIGTQPVKRAMKRKSPEDNNTRLSRKGKKCDVSTAEYDRCCFADCTTQVFTGAGECAWCVGSYNKHKDHKPVFCPEHVNHNDHEHSMRKRSAYLSDA